MNLKASNILASLAVAGVLAMASAQAETTTQDTTRGERTTVVGNPPAGPAYEAVGTHQGPLVEKNVVRQHIINPKRRTIHEQAAVERSMPKCRYVWKRDGANRQSKLVMVHLN